MNLCRTVEIAERGGYFHTSRPQAPDTSGHKGARSKDSPTQQTTYVPWRTGCSDRGSRPAGEAARVKHAVNFAAEPVAAPPARASCPPDVFDCCSHHLVPGSDGTARETAMFCWQAEQSNNACFSDN